jgi:hypothetical protein
MFVLFFIYYFVFIFVVFLCFSSFCMAEDVKLSAYGRQPILSQFFFSFSFLFFVVLFLRKSVFAFKFGGML